MDIRELWDEMECVDLSIPLSAEYPVNWPTLPPFRKHILSWFEDYEAPNGELLHSAGYYYAQSLELDEHTGTHVDFPLHVLPPRELKEQGIGQDTPLNHFAGPAMVIDVTEHLDHAPPGKSPRIPGGVVPAWEATNGVLQAGDIVLLNTGYMERYFAPFPVGNRLIRQPLFSRDVPGWPVPSDELFEVLNRRGVRHIGISSPSIGALDDPSSPHRSGIVRGITFAECLIHLGELPPRGALYIGLPLKIAHQSGSPIRAVAFKPSGSRRLP
jgi:kynurenine formamidase